MLTPNGRAAGRLDRITLLAMWTRHLHQAGRAVISACMGKPTFALNGHAASLAAKHWSDLQFLAQVAHHCFRHNPHSSLTRDKLVQMQGAIDYGDPQGDLDARQMMADALRRWYHHRLPIEPQHLLFTVGGAAAIHLILDTLPKAKVLTPFPHYTLYASNPTRPLHPILVMEEPGYRLTRNALEKSIQRLEGQKIAAFLFCDPNNPLGTLTSPKAWREIAACLTDFPEIPIILDEAYAEMRLDGKPHQSLLELAPALYSRVILLRSATKGLSAAGQRMALLVTPDSNLMTQLLAKNVSMYGHAPRAEQKIFASALLHFDDQDRNDLAAFYAPQVNLALKRLKAMGAAMPDPEYQVEGTFYVLADLSDLFGLTLPDEVAEVLEKSGPIETDEDIAYYLLFQGVSIAPLSYFGISPYAGFMRITCSGGDSQINALCDILQGALTEARQTRCVVLTQV